jgi:hypothetical protein
MRGADRYALKELWPHCSAMFSRTRLGRQALGRLDGVEAGVVVLTFPVRVGFAAIESLVSEYAERAAGSVEWYYANMCAADGETPLARW